MKRFPAADNDCRRSANDHKGALLDALCIADHRRLFFLLLGIQMLVSAYQLRDPFEFILTFFASNFIIHSGVFELVLTHNRFVVER